MKREDKFIEEGIHYCKITGKRCGQVFHDGCPHTKKVIIEGIGSSTCPNFDYRHVRVKQEPIKQIKREIRDFKRKCGVNPWWDKILARLGK